MRPPKHPRRRGFAGLGEWLEKAARRGFYEARRGISAARRDLVRRSAARFAVDFFYMNQQLARGSQNFSTRETQKKCFTEEKSGYFSDPPP